MVYRCPRCDCAGLRATGHHSLVDVVCSFTKQVLAQLDLLEGNYGLQKRSQPLAERDRWTVANLHLHALWGGARCTISVLMWVLC